MEKEFTKELMNQMDFIALEKILSNELKVNVVLTSEFTEHTRGNYVRVKSNDLVFASGIMESVFETLHIKDFGGSYSSGADKYWLPVSLRWEFKKLGGNGTGLFDAFWDFNKKEWHIESRGN